MRVFGLWNPDSSLHSAANRGSTDGVLVALDHGADVNNVDSNGRTPLDHALFLATSPRGTGAGKTEVAQVLIEAGGDLSELHDECLSEQLFLCCFIESSTGIGGPGWIPLIRKLIEAGADVNARDPDLDGATALMDASPEVARVLIEAGAEVEERGWPPYSELDENPIAALMRRSHERKTTATIPSTPDEGLADELRRPVEPTDHGSSQDD